MQQTRTRPAVHVTLTEETLTMLDTMTEQDARTDGGKPDRGRLLRRLIQREHARRAATTTQSATARRKGKR
jgi:hypothetical protein